MAYVATQSPLPNTTEDFWRMVWEQKCATIVMLTQETEGVKMDWHKYWPDSGVSNISHLQVIRHSEDNDYPHYVQREFNIIDTKVSTSVPNNYYEVPLIWTPKQLCMRPPLYWDHFNLSQ